MQQGIPLSGLSADELVVASASAIPFENQNLGASAGFPAERQSTGTKPETPVQSTDHTCKNGALSWSVYALMNQRGIPFYVGCSSNTEQRLYWHTNQGRQCLKLCLKLGWGFFGNRGKDGIIARMLAKGLEPTLEIIASNLDLPAAHALERATIAKIGRRVLGTGPLANIHGGGELGGKDAGIIAQRAAARSAR